LAGWQGAGLVAITYVYFLIFAQFAFLARLAHLGLEADHLKIIMAAMALGGVLFSLLAPRSNLFASPVLRLRTALFLCAAAAFLALLPLSLASALFVSFFIGSGLGLLTVTLVTHLRLWTGDRSPLLMVGLGTGIGYLICNLPQFFTATAEMQSVVAGLLCLAGAALSFRVEPLQTEGGKEHRPSALPFIVVVTIFAALVWLDSTAFFIIQSSPALKAGTWQGSLHLWTNGLLHLSAALGSAFLLSRRGLLFVLSAAFLALGAACLLLLDPTRLALASVFYPIGVSLYSVALVAYPSLLVIERSAGQRGRQAGWIYAIAGWGGSAMGIGMGQNLGYVPPVFLLAAGIAIFIPQLYVLLRIRLREVTLTSIVLLVAFLLNHFLAVHSPSPQLSQIGRGRQVYISEGCIHCHSQYVRPNSPDVLMWGPVEPVSELRLERPPLIGNRRQGPDLSQVGLRRSPLWLKAHFIDPQEVSGSSIMPSFALLFRSQRGDDLVAYLTSLHTSGADEQLAHEKLWQPSPGSLQAANAEAGRLLFDQHCATCHNSSGPTRNAWQANFKRLPPDFAVGPFFYLHPNGPEKSQIIRLAQITKFGIPGTDMPGHEYLPDQQVASISLWLSQTIAQSHQPVQNSPHPGEQP
jgi:cytochrome c oxidase cbb3-type subunit 2